MMELTCPLDSVEHLQSARERKQGKQEYLMIQSELHRLGVECSYSTIEVSVLGHYLTSSLSSLQASINFTLANSVSKPQCRKILDQAASVSITSSRRIFLARDCNEWMFECWQFYYRIYFCICYSLPHPPMRFSLICGSVSPRTHPTLFVYIMLFSSTFWWFLSV